MSAVGMVPDTRKTLQSTVLIEKKKEMQAIQSELEKKRLEFARRMEECREKQDELKAKVSDNFS